MGVNVTRRHLLALSTAIGAAAVIGSGATLITWWKAPAEQPYTNLTTKEAMVINAFSEAAFPGGGAAPIDGKDADLDRFMDALLNTMDSNKSGLIKLLLHVIESSAFLSGRLSFCKMPLADRQQQINEWFDSKNHHLRSAIVGFTTLLGMGYTTHPTVAKELSAYHMCGYGQ